MVVSSDSQQADTNSENSYIFFLYIKLIRLTGGYIFGWRAAVKEGVGESVESATGHKP